MVLDKPNAMFLDHAGAAPIAAGTGILHPDSVKADGSWDKPIGTGPFKFGEWKRGQYVVADRLRRLRLAAGRQARRLSWA